MRYERSESSCELKINAKGLFSGGLKVYDEDSTVCVEDAIRLSERLEKFIKSKNHKESDEQ